MKKAWYATIHTATGEDGIVYADTQEEAKGLLEDALMDEQLFTTFKPGSP